MAEHGVSHTITNAAAAVVITDGLSRSEFAQSLMSASFEQVISGHFYWQFSDVLTLVCSAIVVANFIGTRVEKVRQSRKG
jgi:hypothetical protein